MSRCLFVLVLALPAIAQTADWAAVQGLAPETAVRARLKTGRSFTGRVESVSESNLSLRDGNGHQAFAPAELARVDVRKNGHRRRNTLIGLAAGAAAGLIVGAGIDASDPCKGICVLGRDPGKAIFTPVGALIGTIVGVALPTGGWTTIYESRSP